MSGLLENGPSRAGAACAVYGTRVAARVHPTGACTGVKTGNVHCGAGRGNRTLTLLPELDFESSASTNSAIPADSSEGDLSPDVARARWSRHYRENGRRHQLAAPPDVR